MLAIDNVDSSILNRLREEPPEGCSVVPGSTPVIAFGRFKHAEVATISLNPSHREFELVRGQRRFHTLESLGVREHNEITESHALQIQDYCERYFERPGIVYKDWFDRVSDFLKASSGYDYYDGTACHLDLSQWATSEVWGRLTSKQKKSLVSTKDLLASILSNGNIHTLYLNGKTTSKEIFKYLKVSPKKVILRNTIQGGKSMLKLEGYTADIEKISGTLLNSPIRLIGWNLYLKYTDTEGIEMLSNWVKNQTQQ
ncbi:hypothetical protein [Thalassobacillus sp. CUG 92003]|uniref:hypothetical protein n=1 Tax=Thalassobacillus sp. CUG 92003 TaxID=2736641 RepID=UPI0015E782F5|nr:hypothetical protein [Thalassobacillus sp. CUG 92003]